MLVLMSVLAIKLQHWANIDKPLKPIMKLHKLALIASGMYVILAMLLQPMVISNNPLIKAEQTSFVMPKNDNKKQTTEDIPSITLNKVSILNTTEKIITKPPTANKVFTPLITAFPNEIKKPSFSGVLIMYFILLTIVIFDLPLFSFPYLLKSNPTVMAPK